MNALASVSVPNLLLPFCREREERRGKRGRKGRGREEHELVQDKERERKKQEGFFIT